MMLYIIYIHDIYRSRRQSRPSGRPKVQRVIPGTAGAEAGVLSGDLLVARAFSKQVKRALRTL